MNGGLYCVDPWPSCIRDMNASLTFARCRDLNEQKGISIYGDPALPDPEVIDGGPICSAKVQTMLVDCESCYAMHAAVGR